jgi:iron complex transport system substrate-binding protein
MRSLLRPLALLAVVSFVLSSCGSGSDEPAAESGAAASSEAGAFPVSIKNKFGTAEIETAPKRVVSVGLIEQDALLALDVAPVGTTEWFGERPGALFPWAEDKLGDRPLPTVLRDKDGIQFEKIAVSFL